jgi:hypothetical protein
VPDERSAGRRAAAARATARGAESCWHACRALGLRHGRGVTPVGIHRPLCKCAHAVVAHVSTRARRPTARCKSAGISARRLKDSYMRRLPPVKEGVASPDLAIR